MITLSDDTTTIALPYDLDWTDRTELPIKQATTRSVTGKLIVMTGVGLYGRPITLQPPQGGGWWDAGNEAQIMAWLAEPEKRLTLNWRGEIHTVMFDQTEARPYESEPVFYRTDSGPDRFVLPTFRLTTLEP